MQVILGPILIFLGKLDGIVKYIVIFVNLVNILDVGPTVGAYTDDPVKVQI